MSEINWNDNAKAAVREFAEYVGQTKHCERYLERIVPKQPKTVADAVEYYGKTFMTGQLTRIRCGKDGKMFFASCETDSDNWQDSYLVCTHEQFEAYVKEQGGEKWTHTYSDYGVRKDCILVCDKPDIHGQVLVLNRYDEYVLTGTAEPKPIKPKLTKAEAWDRLANTDILSNLGDEFVRLSREYDII